MLKCFRCRYRTSLAHAPSERQRKNPTNRKRTVRKRGSFTFCGLFLTIPRRPCIIMTARICGRSPSPQTAGRRSPPPIPDNGVVQGGRSGENRPVYSTSNGFYSASKGQHVYVYDGDGKLIYDLSPKRIKCFAINTSPSGKEYFNSGEKINRQYSRIH